MNEKVIFNRSSSTHKTSLQTLSQKSKFVSYNKTKKKIANFCCTNQKDSVSASHGP